MRYREEAPSEGIRGVRPFLLLLLALALLVGCRSSLDGPPPGTQAAAARQATPEQQLADLLAAPPRPGLARIVFYRQAVPFLQSVSPDVIVNGKRVGTAESGSAFIRDARPGGYEVFSTHDPDTLVRFTLEAGETRYVKTGLAFRGLGFRLSTEEVPARRALPELADLDLGRDRMAGRAEGGVPGGAGRR